ncbi:acyl-CoA dehydrogenase family protein [Humitalea sp. 24SJ18S-53]|uniref:acyl-CoA dehydrogenase family protein n=1 Tax=Humitalea sp. 24SJ18S-53 TaxID=3422307 RepID=UPI003D67F76E
MTSAADDLILGLTRIVDLPGLTAAAGAPLEAADIEAVIREAERFAAEAIAPGWQEADRHGTRLENGVVRVPPHYGPLYGQWIESGWQSLAAPVAHGGQGLPHALWSAVQELCSAADMAFTLGPMLTAGAVELLAHHATPDQAARWLPELAAGRWTGTMCLTEPQAGSDLSTVRTRAEPDGNGGYRLFGQKVFITWGDHDLAENILHLVLARLPGAPEGSRGISLFAAPKTMPDGSRNGVACGGVEHKMGIHASPTCIMLFDGAEAELIGEANRGLPAMFAMMNAARLGVAVQGVGQGARALALAEAYAAGREQGGRVIATFPDVARMLAEMRSVTLAGRLLALEAAACLDRAALLGDADADARLALLTPIVKSWCTDRGVANASLGVQVHGGMGFCEDAGAAQVLRDSRIAPIYEGTNGIQALDLVGRKLPRDGGALLRVLLAEAVAAAPAIGPAAAAVEQAIPHMLGTGGPGGAAPFLDACGWVLGAGMVARAAAADPAHASTSDFYIRRLLPRALAGAEDARAA